MGLMWDLRGFSKNLGTLWDFMRRFHHISWEMWRTENGGKPQQSGRHQWWEKYGNWLSKSVWRSHKMFRQNKKQKIEEKKTSEMRMFNSWFILCTMVKRWFLDVSHVIPGDSLATQLEDLPMMSFVLKKGASPAERLLWSTTYLVGWTSKHEPLSYIILSIYSWNQNDKPFRDYPSVVPLFYPYIFFQPMALSHKMI